MPSINTGTHIHVYVCIHTGEGSCHWAYRVLFLSGKWSSNGIFSMPARTSHVTRHTSHVTRHTSHVTRHTSHMTRHTSHVTRHTPHVTHCARTTLTCGHLHGGGGSLRHQLHRRDVHGRDAADNVTRHTPHTIRHTSHATRHTPHVTRHKPHTACHTSHVTRHTSRCSPPVFDS